jgi:predicted hydrocarbon binding protein
MSSELGDINTEVINALLESFYDVLDKDGKRSILVFANLEDDLMDTKLPPGLYPYSEFLKIVQSMKQLMAYSGAVMQELGKKFAIYLNPFGTDFKGFIEMLNSSFGSSKLNITTEEGESSESKRFHITMLNCPFIEHDGYTEGICDFFEGMFVEGLRKSMGGTITVEKKNCLSNPKNICEFILFWSKLK